MKQTKSKQEYIAEAIAQAALYKSRSEFFKKGHNAYCYLQKCGLLNQSCVHMPLSPKYSRKRWTPAEVFIEAGKYSSRAEFKRENPGAYEFALSNRFLNQACSHMRDGKNFWHLFELMAVAVKYDDWGKFIAAEPQAYNYVNKNKLQKIASSHMFVRREWTRETVMAEAAKHQSRGLFQAAASGAYKHADNNGYLDEACAHMPAPEYGFSKEKIANLYHIKISIPEGQTLYKVGITNRDPAARISGMGIPSVASVEILAVIRFNCGRDARIAEKRLHRKFKDSRYNGAPVLKNGNTELFTVPLI